MSSTLSDSALFYTLDETSGSRAESVTGAYPLVQNGTVSSRVGRRGRAAVFTNTAGQCLSLATNATIARGDNPWTWSFWTQPDSAANGQYLLTQADSGGAGTDWYLSTSGGGTNWNLQAYNAGVLVGSVSSSGTTPTVGVWYHIVLYYDKARGKLGIVVNANPADEVTCGAPGSTGSSLRVGGLFSGAVVGYAGAVDNLAFWTRVLSTAEIRELYSAGAAPAHPFDVSPRATAQGGVAGTSASGLANLAAWNAAKSLLPGTPADALFIGDSILQGFQSAAPLTTMEACGFVDWLRLTLQRTYGTLGGGRGFLPLSAAVQDSLQPGSYTDLRWSFGGANITPPSPNDWGLKGYVKGVGGGSGSSISALYQYGDTFDVFLLEGSTLNTGIVTVQIGTESPVTVGTGTPPLTPTINRYTVTSTAGVGTRAVKLIANATVGIDCYLVGVVARVGNAGVRVHQAGYAGATAGDLFATDNLLKWMDPFAASPFNTKLVVIATTANDFYTQVPLATFKANVERAILKAQAMASAPSVLLVAGNPRVTPPGMTLTQAQYNTQLSDLATQYGCTLVSVYDRWVSVANADSLALTPGAGDVHPTDLGHEDYAAELHVALDPPVTPDPPTALAGSRRVVLTWAASDFATAYRLRRTLAGATSTIYDGPLLTYTDAPAGGSPPSYTVSAYNVTGESAQSAAVTPAGLGSGGAPAIVVNNGFLVLE